MRMTRVSATASVLGLAAALCAGQTRKEMRLEIAPGGTINIVNHGGSVNLKSGAGNHVVVAYTAHSPKVEVDETSTANHRRIEIRTHVLPEQKPATEEGKVDYEITVPAGISVTVNTSTAPITVDGLRGELSLSSDTGHVTVHNVAHSLLRVRGVAAPVSLSNITGGHVDVATISGAVQMTDVTGPKVTVATTSGNIEYHGDCSGVGDYLMTTHSGNIELTLPPTASVDLMARSVSGQVENDFPLQEKAHPSFVPRAGSSFAGTSNSGSSSVELQSFSGRIRVKKQ
jgi:DUF4097 and DUF4098 domain-containing protein YvlB